MTPWVNEGFFADVVVLVEGETDRAAILGAALLRNIDLESQGIAIIPCGGKDSIDRPFLVFSGLDIPTYVIFDADATCDQQDLGKVAKSNRMLQRLLGSRNPVDFPQTLIGRDYAVFQSDLSRTVRDAVGEEIYVNKVWTEFQRDRGYPKLTHAQKAPAFVTKVLEEARAAGIEIRQLDDVVESILAKATGATTV
jgi:predicted ATP-dependent endonuclease of OLD family